jgi:hypothetical protein
MQGAQICQADGTFAPCVCVPETYQRVKAGMVGTWVGVETSPWVDPFTVRVVFGADGHYSAHCAQASCPAAVFYYGTDDDSPEKTYALTDVHADETCSGKIAIFFFPGDSTVGSLEAVTLSDDGQHLRFEFWSTWGGRSGPVVFDLTRAM